jgi:hypothetical protein
MLLPVCSFVSMPTGTVLEAAACAIPFFFFAFLGENLCFVTNTPRNNSQEPLVIGCIDTIRSYKPL